MTPKRPKRNRHSGFLLASEQPPHGVAPPPIPAPDPGGPVSTRTVADRPEPTEPPPSGETNRWLVLVIVCLAQFMVILDATVVNVALPSIQQRPRLLRRRPAVGGQRLHAGVRRLPAARRPRRRPRSAAEGCSSPASSSSPRRRCSTASRRRRSGSSPRGRCRASAPRSSPPPRCRSSPRRSPKGADRTKALGVWSAIAAGGGAFGLLLGGILTEALSWEWIFFVNVPVGIATLALALRYVPESRAASGTRRLDLAGAVTVTAGLIVLVYAIVKARTTAGARGRRSALAAIAARPARRVRRHRVRARPPR